MKTLIKTGLKKNAMLNLMAIMGMMMHNFISGGYS
jgi:hypothetical protein